MRKLVYILIAVIGFGLLYSCEEKEKTILEVSNVPSLTTPTNGSTVSLTPETEDNAVTFSWNALAINLTNLAPVQYQLQIANAGTNFADFKVLSTTEETTYATTVAAFNEYLIAVLGAEPNLNTTVDLRVFASFSASSEAEDYYSETATVTVTPYEVIIIVDPIYMLGDGTQAGWNNAVALEMTPLPDGQFEIISTLIPGGFLKFIGNLGAWAPQWGTDANGTSAAGNLLYRPDETVPDPAGIPTPEEAGTYRIVADTANLSYTIELSPENNVYMLGDGTAAGWNNATAISMTYVSPGVFKITADLLAGNIKFIRTLGAWAPQWGTDESGTSASGNLVYRPDETVADPLPIPSPGVGTWVITIDVVNLTYTIVAAK